MKTEKTFEEAVKLDCIIKGKNSLSLSSYGLQTLVNLIFNGWTIEDIGNAFKEPPENVKKLLEEKGYYNFQKDVEKLKEEIKILDEKIKDKAKSLKQEKGQEDRPEKMIIRDGVAFPEKYLSSKTKILWILKESYEKNKVYFWHSGGIETYNPETIKIIRKSGGTLRMVSLITFALLHKMNFQRAKEVIIANEYDLIDAVQRVAWLNLGKIAAKNTSANDLTYLYETWKEILDMQIKLYKPDIIICGNTMQYFSNDKEYNFNLPKERKQILKSIIPNENEKYCYYPLEERGNLYINIHHPSCREKSKTFNGSWNECINELVDIVSEWNKKRKQISS